MSVRVKNGIGYSERTAAVYIDMASSDGNKIIPARKITSTREDPRKDTNIPWAKWGKNNLFPQELTADIEKTGILNALLDMKARFACCNGVLPALVHYSEKGEMVIDKIVMEAEIDEFLEENNSFFQVFGWMKDQCGFSNGVARLMLNDGGDKIASFQRDDVTEMRYQRMDPQKNGSIDNIFLSADWKAVGSNPKHELLVTVDHLPWNNPLASLREKAQGKKKEFALTFKHPGWGRKYYSLPLWYAAHLWVKIAQGVPEMKAAMFQNNFRPKYMVVISKTFWDNVFLNEGSEAKNWDDYKEEDIQKKKNEIYDQIDNHLFGNQNSYKTIFVDGIHTPEGKLVPEIEIIAIDDKTKDGEFLPDSATANSEIAFATLVNPAILGASMPSGPYSNSQGGSNVRESTLIQVILHQLEREQIRRIFNVIKRFNGWDKTYQKPGTKLEFIIPAVIPTTLDTGSNVKPMVTGANPVNKENQQ